MPKQRCLVNEMFGEAEHLHIGSDEDDLDSGLGASAARRATQNVMGKLDMKMFNGPESFSGKKLIGKSSSSAFQIGLRPWETQPKIIG